MIVIGFTGHQGLTSEVERYVEDHLRMVLTDVESGLGLSSLAAGSDQLFAQVVLDQGLTVGVVVPSRQYDDSFRSQGERANYHRLLALARSVETLDYNEPSEEAYYAAGRRIADLADRLIAVWDGQPSRGLGGTADIVEYARKMSKDVQVIWPPNTERS